MPADAIHLSAFADSLCGASEAVTRLVRGAEIPARIGVMFVDLPYFSRFELGLLRYVTGLPQALSPWGDRFHQAAPIELGVRLAEEGARLRRQATTRDAGDALVALSLGYISHAAVDTSLHPLVNRLAVDRGAVLGTGAFIREHQEIEKFHSVLFHEARHGFDFLGTPELGQYLSIDWRPLFADGAIARAVQAVAQSTFGLAPRRRDFALWARGYRFFVWLIAGPIGRRVVSEEEKRREKPKLFDACNFAGRYAQAVERSAAWMNALLDYVADGHLDESARAQLARAIPEQSLDPAPEA